MVNIQSIYTLGGYRKKLVCMAALVFTTSAFAEWKSDSELGFVSQSGNTNQENVLAKTNISQVSGANTYTVNGEYINSAGEVSGQDVRLAESVLVGLKFERTLSEKLGVYVGTTWKKNRFQGIDQEYGLNTGLKYMWFNEEDFSLFNTLGYEHRNQTAYITEEKTKSNFIVGGLELNKKLSDTSNFRFWVNAKYDLSDSENYEVQFEPSIDVNLGEFMAGDSPARIGLKVAYKGEFDNVPALAGYKKYDSTFTTSLKVLY